MAYVIIRKQKDNLPIILDKVFEKRQDAEERIKLYQTADIRHDVKNIKYIIKKIKNGKNYKTKNL